MRSGGLADVAAVVNATLHMMEAMAGVHHGPQDGACHLAGALRALAHAGGYVPTTPADQRQLDRRNSCALQALDDHADRDAAMPCGFTRLPGLAAGLAERGYRPRASTWHHVGRLPPR